MRRHGRKGIMVLAAAVLAATLSGCAQHSTFKKNESEHLENNSSDSHQHTDRYRYYARSNELHGIKTKTTAHLNMRRVVIFVLPRIPVMKGQSH